MKENTKAHTKIKVTAKRRYSAPTLTRYGKLTEITAGGSGSAKEGTKGLGAWRPNTP